MGDRGKGPLGKGLGVFGLERVDVRMVSDEEMVLKSLGHLSYVIRDAVGGD